MIEDKKGQFVTKEVEDILIGSIRIIGSEKEMKKTIGKLFIKFGMLVKFNPFVLFYEEEYVTENIEMEVCVPLKKEPKKLKEGMSSYLLKGGRFLCYIHHGTHDNLCNSYEKIQKYTRDNDIQVILPYREIYLKGPGLFKGNPEKYQTEIQIGLK